MTTATQTRFDKNDETLLLKNKALLVKIIRKKMSRNTTDKGLSELLSDMKQCKKAGLVRVQKTLFPKKTTDTYQHVITECGKYFYKVTTPWDDRGYRLLSIKMYKEFAAKIKAYTTDFREKVNTFVETLEASINEMKEELGDAFNKDDYAHLFHSNGTINKEAILDQFHLEIEYSPVTDADDLRASLTETDREIIAAQITEQNERKFAKSQIALAQKLKDAIVAIHERLSKQENIFRDSLIENLEELCDLIPKLNVANDPVINDIAADARKLLCTWTPQEIRDDPVKRNKVSKEADKLVSNMQGMI